MIDKRLKYGTFDERTRVGVVANMFLEALNVERVSD